MRTIVLITVVMLVASGAGLSREVEAEERHGVDVWATLGSAAPAVGCAVKLSVEVHAADGPAPGVDVLVGLVINDDVVATSRAVTAEDGIAFLDIDTGYGASRDAARVEINVAGVYVGRITVTLTDDGPCTGNPRMLTTSADIWAPDSPAGANPGIDGAGGMMLEVPSYAQQRNLSCEYAALSIATGAFGAAISEYEFDKRVGWSSNPHWGYRGDINGRWGNTTDYGVYPEPLVGPLSEFGFAGEVLYGGDPASLTDHLDQGQPTLVWVGLWGETGADETLEDGTIYKLLTGYHVVVAYGYDAWGVYVADPATGGRGAWDWSTFLAMWEVMDGMALAVAPAS